MDVTRQQLEAGSGGCQVSGCRALMLPPQVYPGWTGPAGWCGHCDAGLPGLWLSRAYAPAPGLSWLDGPRGVVAGHCDAGA